MRKTKSSRSILTILLATIMVIEAILSFPTMRATEKFEYKGGAGTKVSDPDTSTRYLGSLGENESTEYAGRIWTDKSVYTDDVTFDVFGGKTATIKLNEGGNLGEDFLIAYSALATLESVSGQTQAPVDVVLIIDISGSMSNQNSNMDNGFSRIYNTVQATNSAIDSLMGLNPYTRVAVVAFSNNAQVLLPLDRYTKVTETEQTWVQTGPGRNDGYFEETEVEVPYFSVNRQTGSSSYATLSTSAINSNGGTIELSTSVQGGTNIQMGLYEGMQVLAEEDSTTIEIEGATVQRMPSVILLSDGSPTYSSSSQKWWAPSDNNSNGPGSTPYAGNGMKAILVGSYMKDAIDRNYNVANTAFATTVYTIGMGITGLATDEKNLAYITLDPGTYLNDSNVTNSMKTTIKEYWESYTSKNNTGTLNINVGKLDGRNYVDSYYSLTHPTTGYDVDPQNGYDYVNAYYNADNALAVIDVFEEIVSNISISAPQVPTELKGGDPISDGYITYTDPIGEYMEVKDIKAIIYAGTTFTAKDVMVSNSTTAYTFSGTVDSVVYGYQEIKNILITVEESNDKQTLIIKIPASVIPLRINEVMLNSDGSVKSHTNNGTLPARVIYSVGLQSDILKESENGIVYVDKSKISLEYLKANTNADGTINFYSNVYSSSKNVNNIIAGDAMAEFEASHNNSFYYILSDMPIYKDSAFTQQVTAIEGLDDHTVYYYKDEYYHGTSVKVNAVACTGAQLEDITIKKGTDDCLYIAAGSPHPEQNSHSEGIKELNVTNTAETFYTQTFQYAEESTDAYDGKFVIYHGNNGLLSLVAGGNLKISKTVNADPGLTAPDKTFEFVVRFNGTDVSHGIYEYVIVDTAGEEVETGTIFAKKNKINLKDGQSATIFGLPPGTIYTVTETAVDGFTIQSEGDTGTIAINETSVATFTNTYHVDPVTYPAQDTLKGTKNLTGKPLSAGEFYFDVIEYFNEQKVLKRSVTNVADSKADADGIYSGKITFFENVTYNRPGKYEYIITEQIPQTIDNGITYDESKYRYTVIVEDDKAGKLVVTSAMLEKSNGSVWEPAAEVVFNNTYVPRPTTIRLPLIKKVLSGDRSEPLKAGEFKFEIARVYAEHTDGMTLPMQTIVSNGANGNVVFDNITFSKAGIYIVSVEEKIPDEADKVAGITYSTQKIMATYQVVDDYNGMLTATLTQYSGGEEIVNQYAATPGTAEIEISKDFTGRENDEWLATDKFDFEIVALDETTKEAIENGEIEIQLDSSNSEIATKTIDTKGKTVSSMVIVNKPGIYKFNVREVKGNIPGVSYDTKPYEVVITATDDSQNARIKVTINNQDTDRIAINFRNSYVAEATEPIEITAKKKVTVSKGNNYTLNGGEFSFVIEGTQGAPMPAYTIVTNDANGHISFGTVQFTEAGIYTYTIREVQENLAGFIYDGEVYTIIVEVTDDATEAKLKAKVKSINKSNEEVSAVFDNKYNPAETSVIIFGNKKLEGDHKQLEADEFAFSIKAITPNAPMPAVTVVNNVATGAFQFDAISYTKVGVYKYEITEMNLNKAGYIYDNTSYIVTVTVTDEGNGQLQAEIDGVGTVLAPAIQFVNKYIPAPVEVILGADGELLKELDGREMNEDEFVFAVLDNAGTEITTAKNNKDGTFEFILNFTKADIYQYKIVEKNNSISGVTYDEKIYDVQIVITDKGGCLGVDSTIYTFEGEAVDNVVFSNTYKADDTQLIISATKKLIGRTLIDNEFKFVLKDKNGNVIATAGNSKDGKIVFDKIIFTAAGFYTYTVTEEMGTLESITYDKTEYVIEVEVIDNGNGKLVALTPVIKDAGSNDTVSEIVFENTYAILKPPVLPETGDVKTLGLWFVLLFVSGAGIFGLHINKCKGRTATKNK